MSDYRRLYQPGGTYFFTVVTAGRAPILCTELGRECLRGAFHATLERIPFEAVATALLPDHLHTVWILPDGDRDFSSRWSFLKRTFTQGWLARGGAEREISTSKQQSRRRGVWQRRFWEHLIRDMDDFGRHCDYIHFNPVKHGLVTCPHEWPYTTFASWVNQGHYAADWCCGCNGRHVEPPAWGDIEQTAPE